MNTVLRRAAGAGGVPCRWLSLTARRGDREKPLRRAPHPYDRRFPLSAKKVSEFKKGGTVEWRQKMGSRPGMPQMPGYKDKQGEFVFVPEMVPEFVVPDLTDFELKPYVSYSVTNVVQREFTAKDLFDSTYAEKVLRAHEKGKLDVEKPVSQILEESKS